MLRKVLFCMFFIILASGYGQVGKVLFSRAHSVPKMLNYQGYLTDTLGSPIDDSLDMTFKIFDAATVGNELWSETQTDVPVERGVFNVVLGDVNPIPDTVFTTGTDRWLELTLEGPQTLSPRTRITAVGYAYTSTYSDTAEYARAGAADNDWVRATPDSVLFTANYLGIARGGADNMLYGTNVYTHTNLGVACTTGTSGVDYYYCTVAGGYNNTASVTVATVAGGRDNTASGYYATVAGGDGNTASGGCANVAGGYGNTASGGSATVAGGFNNTASGQQSTVAGGWDNTASGYYAAVAGGWLNTADGECANVAGGYSNTASGDCAAIGGGDSNTADEYSATVAGGFLNNASSEYATVSGGYADTVKGRYGGILSGYSNSAGDEAEDTAAVVVGGWANSAINKYSFVGGGKYNTASGNWATVAGGYADTASGWAGTVGGGLVNTASGWAGTVAGGESNNASDSYATVGGGWDNTASDISATVAGGEGNDASAQYATVAGGNDNSASGIGATVGGGYYNSASAYCATVAGGYADTVDASYGFAASYSSKVVSGHDNSAAFTGSHTIGAAQVRALLFSTGAGVFTMDHPSDPMNKILNQYAVGASEAILMYSGTAFIDEDGHVAVNLPDYFHQINRNPRIQLTGVGTSDVYVAEDISENHFTIGGKPGTKVYWTVTAERKDMHAEIARILTPVEQPKTGDLIGHSLDDDALISTYEILQQTGNGAKFKFRTEDGRRVYEESKRIIEEERKERRE